MQNCQELAVGLYYLGGNDRRLALFESAYPVPRGVSYNAYLLKDEKTVLFDTVDIAVGDLFFDNLACALGEDKLDYVVVQHMEPDHSATFARLLELYPDVTVIASQKAAVMLKNYFGYTGKAYLVKEGDTLSIGKRTLTFIGAPMVHWPEVLFTYVPEEGFLFSADAFGTFGALAGNVIAEKDVFAAEYLDDARRYYFNIVGKYGVQVQSVLKKAAGLKISMVCPLHGPIWKDDFAWYLEKYLTWSAYKPEDKCVAVFYASVYGHTQNAAEILASAIGAEGVRVKVFDVSVTHPSELLSEAFRCSHAVFASTTYNNGIFVNMENFLNDLKAHNYQNRAYAIVENGSWAPQAGSLMDGILAGLKNMRRIGEKTTVLSAVNASSREALVTLGKQIAEDVKA